MLFSKKRPGEKISFVILLRVAFICGYTFPIHEFCMTLFMKNVFKRANISNFRDSRAPVGRQRDRETEKRTSSMRTLTTNHDKGNEWNKNLSNECQNF